MMSQSDAIKFLCENKIDVTNMNYNLLNDIMTVAKRMAEKESELIADQDEVLKYLTSVLRGESESEIVVVEGVGDGCSEARNIHKTPDEKERLKAAELLGKRYGLYTEKIETDIDMDLNIVIDYGEGD